MLKYFSSVCIETLILNPDSLWAAP